MFFTTTNAAKDEIVQVIAGSESIGPELRERVAAEFDVDEIFDVTYAWDSTRQAFYCRGDHDTFWTVVQRHAR